jgi:hypothetical protein
MGRQFADTRRIAMGTVSAWPNRAGAHAAFADHLLNELDTVVNTAPNQSSASVGKLRYYLLTYAESALRRALQVRVSLVTRTLMEYHWYSKMDTIGTRVYVYVLGMSY